MIALDRHLLLLQIVVPLLAAPMCVLIRSRRLVIGWTIGVCLVTFAMACRLLHRVMVLGALEYELGGWPAPWGIEYRADTLSAFVIWLVSAIGAVVICYAPRSLDREIPRGQHYLFCTLYLLCLTGLLGMVATGDFFNLFVFLEISSLSSYALISMARQRQAILASFQYLVMGTIGATFLLIGIGLCYQMTGSLNMADLANHLGPLLSAGPNRTVLVAFAFISVGLMLKMAIFPLHLWLPGAYSCAPSVVTAFIAATATKVSVYAFIRVIFSIFKPSFAFGSLPLDVGLMALSLIGIYVASAAAIFQQDVKRVLAYSSIAQVGYMALGISFASVGGLTAGIVHLLHHALIKASLFMAVGCWAYRSPGLRLSDLSGIGRRMPVSSLAFALAGLGLIGTPLTAGFVSKWLLIVAALQSGNPLVAVLVLISSLLSIIYVWRVVEVVFFGEPAAHHAEVEPAREAPLSMLIPTYLLIVAMLLFGVWTTYSAGIAQHAAVELLGGSP